ncbi:MAG TPA: alginate export family protein [Sphingobium sp.]|nr:alginate export family protein [Sphingobium sp.]
MLNKNQGLVFLAAVAAASAASPVSAKSFPVGSGLTLTPSIDARLRYENVSRPAPLQDGDAVTVRVRPGITLGTGSGFSVLVEGEGTLGIEKDYDAFPFPGFGKDGLGVIADPENIELNRAQIQYKSKAMTLTGGRQRINLDDQRFVGSVGWRQNEQTFDAVRAEATLGPVTLDGTYSWSQRTIFGIDAGRRQAYSGEFLFLGAAAALGPVKVKAFSYLLDFDAKEPVALTSTQTYGARATAAFKLAPKATLNLAASYATQSDYKLNPGSYSADYIAAEAGLGYGNYTVTGGYELLGSDNGAAFQTPLATLHKFNGWADLFLTTPAAGLQDIYVGLAAKFPQVKALPGLNAAVIYHDFQSDVGDVDYGGEWNASLGFKVWKTSLLFKYADYDAKGFGVDTSKFWVQLEWAY